MRSGFSIGGLEAEMAYFQAFAPDKIKILLFSVLSMPIFTLNSCPQPHSSGPAGWDTKLTLSCQCPGISIQPKETGGSQVCPADVLWLSINVIPCNANEAEFERSQNWQTFPIPWKATRWILEHTATSGCPQQNFSWEYPLSKPKPMSTCT